MIYEGDWLGGVRNDHLEKEKEKEEKKLDVAACYKLSIQAGQFIAIDSKTAVFVESDLHAVHSRWTASTLSR